MLVDGAAPPRLEQPLQTFKRDVRRTVAPTIRSACSLAHHHPPRAVHRSLSRRATTAIHRAPCTDHSRRATTAIHRAPYADRAPADRPPRSTARLAPPALPRANIHRAPCTARSRARQHPVRFAPLSPPVNLHRAAAHRSPLSSTGIIDRAASTTCATVDLARDRLKVHGSHAHPAALLMPTEPSMSSRGGRAASLVDKHHQRAPRPRGVPLATATALYTAVALRRRVLGVTSALEARAGLVPTSVFKTDGSSRERRIGGFDSLAFPLIYAAYGERREPAPSPRTHLGPADVAIWRLSTACPHALAAFRDCCQHPVTPMSHDMVTPFSSQMIKQLDTLYRCTRRARSMAPSLPSCSHVSKPRGGWA